MILKKGKGLTLLDFKTFYKVEVTKAVLYKHRHIDRGSRTQKLELNIHGHLTIDKEAKKYSIGKEESFQQMMLGIPDIQVQKKEFETLLHIIYKN